MLDKVPKVWYNDYSERKKYIKKEVMKNEKSNLGSKK